MAAPPHHRTLNLTHSLPCRSKLLSATAYNTIASIATTACVTSFTLKCELSSPQNPKPLKSASPRPFLSLTKTLAVSAATGIIFSLAFSAPSLIGNGSGGCGGGGGGRGGGVGGFGDGSLWSRLLSPAAIAKNEESPPDREWHSHGLPANLVIQLSRLSGSKKYKVSEILFLDCGRWTKVSTEDPFFQTVPLRPGGIYTKDQFEGALRMMSNSSWFEKADLEGKTNPDGTIAIKISFTESTWGPANKFTCINVGLIPKPKRINPDMTLKEKLEYLRRRHEEYRRRMEMARPCMLPMTVQEEVLEMLREEGNLGARLMVKIWDRVEKWYHDEGYVLARVVNLGNLQDTDEVVCEVLEGDITQLVIQFQDKLGKVCEGKTHLGVVKREFPEQVSY